MNLFLTHEDADQSAVEFVRADRIRANKQLLECCQLLAEADHSRFGKTSMLRVDGQPYARTHSHHPVTVMVSQCKLSWELCRDIAVGLAGVLPKHACTASLGVWLASDVSPPTGADSLICFRSGYPPKTVNSRKEYADVMSSYLLEKWERDRAKKEKA